MRSSTKGETPQKVQETVPTRSLSGAHPHQGSNLTQTETPSEEPSVSKSKPQAPKPKVMKSTKTPEPGISRLTPSVAESRLQKMVEEVVGWFNGRPDVDAVWMLRCTLRRSGAGSWSDFPKVLQQHVTRHTLELVRDPKWVEVQVRALFTHHRPWSSRAAARILILLAGFHVMCKAGELIGSK